MRGSSSSTGDPAVDEGARLPRAGLNKGESREPKRNGHRDLSNARFPSSVGTRIKIEF